MHPLEAADLSTICSGRADWIGPGLARRLAHHPLASIDTEFPHHSGPLESTEPPTRPRENHPVFFGCYDWHSAVHSHWALVRQLRLLSDHPDREAIIESIDGRLTHENVEQERAYLEANPTFERPYGWGWLLLLAGELHLWEDPVADRWADALEPLEAWIRTEIRETWLPLERPLRIGTHYNSAFSLHRILEYARTTNRPALESAVRSTALACFEADEDYPFAYEPFGWDFHSPGLTEAHLLSNLLEPAAFTSWFDGFLPGSLPETVATPVRVDEETADGLALHFVGMNLARAWCLAGVTDTLEADHRLARPLTEATRAHARVGLEQAFTDDYAGAHWLSSFALYLLTSNENGIAVGPRAEESG